LSGAAELAAAARRWWVAGRTLEARLALAASLAALAAPQKIRPVVVGGTAVDFYAALSTPSGLEPSRSLRASRDVDVITVGEFGDAGRLRLLLEASPEFEADEPRIPAAQCRKWWLRGAPLLVEVMSGDLYGDPQRVVTVEFEGGEAYLWAPEDTAWQYAQSAQATRHQPSWERALAIARAQDLDWDYLRTRPDALAPAALVDALEAGDGYDAMLERLGAA
jgi:hypothetical protein